MPAEHRSTFLTQAPWKILATYCERGERQHGGFR